MFRSKSFLSAATFHYIHTPDVLPLVLLVFRQEDFVAEG